MTELNAILGAILRDIAKARVVADVFSREASLAYREDDVLKSFPVPRMEIGQAQVDLAFAVTGVVNPEVDPKDLIETLAAPLARGLAQQLVRALVVSSPRREEAEARLNRLGLDLVATVATRIERALEDDSDPVIAAARGDSILLERLATSVVRAIVVDETGLAALLGRGLRVDEVRSRITDETSAALVELQRRVERAGGVQADVNAAVRASAQELAARVVAELSEVAPRPDETRDSLKASQQRLRDVFSSGLRDLDAGEVVELVAGEKPVLRRELNNALSSVVLDERGLRDLLTKRVPIARLYDSITQVVRPWASEAGRAIEDATKRAEQRPPSVTIAVTAQELEAMPAERLSRITLTASVRNYQWSTGIEDGAETTDRLVPE